MLRRGRIQHERIPLRYCDALDDMISPLILPPDSLNFEHENVRIITDQNPQDFPTRENIVSHSYEMSQMCLHFVQLGAMRALVHDAQPHDSLFFYCT
jgi:hypothetical protein